MRRRAGKLIMFVQDLPTEAARSVGMLHDGFLLRLGSVVERAAYQQADHIVVISGAFVKYIRSLGAKSVAITEIPNWAEVDAIRPSDPDTAMRSRLGAGARDFLVVHSGNMGAKQDLINVVAAAELLQSETSIKIALVGDGTERTLIEEAVRARKLNNLTLVPLQPAADFPRVLAAADVLLINQAPLVVDSVLPSKLLAYMAAQRPVLAAVHEDSATADLVFRASCGVVAAAGQPAALAESIRLMAAASRQNGDMSAMGRRGRSYVVEHFQRGVILRQWEDLVARLVS
jgi:glycosyltransferase involved in cell wall biosynthesis